VSETYTKLPLDATWEQKEYAYEEVIRDLRAELRDDAPLADAEEIDDALGRELRALRGVPGYEYLAQVDRRREGQERQRAESWRSVEVAEAERMRGCTDDPPF